MAKPRLIILVRHAQSEGNKNRDIHQTVPDHRVKITPEGWSQARDAGRRLRNLLRPDDTLQIFTSPYRRTRETTEGILSTLTSDDPEPSPFRRTNIKVYEEPRLREQDFGNFQPCSAEMERMWQERADYGHFFYRIPNGESAADAYDRVSGFNESLWRQFGDDDFASVCVLVTHGLMSRVFLMKWYHFTVEYFEDLRNVDHCEFLIMRKQENGKYLLENNLRTWSELRREKALASKDKDDKDKDKDETKLERSRTFVVTRRWGGCPNGCNHTSHYKKRHDLEALRQKDIENSLQGLSTNGSGISMATRKHRHKSTVSSNDGIDGDDEHSDQHQRQHTHDGTREHHHHHHHHDHQHPTTRSLDEMVVSSSDGTPIYVTGDDGHHRLKSPHMHLHLGRDFGGTFSGRTSIADSESDGSENGSPHHRRQLSVRSVENSTHVDGGKNGDEHAFANRLGDASPPGAGSGADDIDQAEKEDRSIQGSVY